MLTVTFTTFRWYRPKTKAEHFRWSEDNDPLLLAGGHKCAEYSPEEHEGLFRTFADLGSDPEKILDFANKFGLLVGRSQDDIDKRRIEPGQDWPHGIASIGCHGPSTFRLSDWLTRISEMKSLVNLVEMMKSDMDHPNRARRVADPEKNREDFLRALRWHPPGANRPVELSSPRSADELVDVAVGKLVDRLKVLLGSARADVKWDGVNRCAVLSIVPDDLGHFLYWQLLGWFVGSGHFRQCSVCGKWEQPARPDCWDTCSTACRTKKSRNKIKHTAAKRSQKK